MDFAISTETKFKSSYVWFRGQSTSSGSLKTKKKAWFVCCYRGFPLFWGVFLQTAGNRLKEGAPPRRNRTRGTAAVFFLKLFCQKIAKKPCCFKGPAEKKVVRQESSRAPNLPRSSRALLKRPVFTTSASDRAPSEQQNLCPPSPTKAVTPAPHLSSTQPNTTTNTS